MIPDWLHLLAIAYLLLGAVCAVVIAFDEIRHLQHMWIMNLVWRITALFGTVWILWQYFVYGRLATREQVQPAMQRGQDPPNKKLTPYPVMVANGAGQGIIAAVKADTLSLTAWQVGMYGFIAFAYFFIFRAVLHAAMATDTVEFWFMMQIAMIFGFLTAYPVNWWLIRAGFKEAM